MMLLSVEHRSECGGRKENEDSVGFCANETQGCFVLADGTGGYEGGALASNSVVGQVLAHFSTTPRVDSDVPGTLMMVAREVLYGLRELNPQLPDMNTTLATLLLDAERGVAYWNYLGDSRIYLFRNGSAQSLTTDHSVLQSMIDAGYCTETLRGNHQRNTLYAAVCCDETPENAVHDEPFALQPGDVFLLCSDGFWENFDEAVMEEKLRQAESPEQWIDEMMDEISSLDPSNLDNFSALVVCVGEWEAKTAGSLPEECRQE